MPVSSMALPRARMWAAVAVAGALALTACSSSSSGDPQPSASTSSSPSSSSSSSSSAAVPTATIDDVTASGAFGTDPDIVIGDGAKPVTELESADLVVGNGAVVEPGATITFNYKGVGLTTGTTFDSSFDPGREPLQYPLGGLITGWQEGIPGMKVGGRRLLVIPGDLAYGPNPDPRSGIEPNETLVFVIDIVSIP